MSTKLSFLSAVMLLCYFAQAQVSVIGELSHDREAKPGERYEGVIVIRNDTNEQQEAKVYQTDYMFYRDGTNNYADPGTLPRSNAMWVTFSPSYLTVPPQGTVTINYAVAVPASTDDRRLNGSYWSMLMVEGIPKGSAESALPRDPKKTQMGIRQTIRYGIQIATHIAQTGTKTVGFLDTKLVTKEDGKRFLQVDLENTGDLFMRPEVYVELFNEQGVSQGKFSGVRFRMYPGTSVRQMIDLSTVAAGTYKALVVVDAGGDDIYGAEYTLKF
ncbi:MAG: hypothetical protein FJ217_14880 [Ignavibacteria bacterium]|nr:hypothetical protein [Ignavibacteria bacterium]